MNAGTFLLFLTYWSLYAPHWIWLSSNRAMESSSYISGHSLERWELRGSRVLCLLEQADKQKGSRRQERGASPPAASAASSEKDFVWMAVPSALCQDRIWHWLTLGSFLHSFQEQLVALQKCSPSVLNHSLMALQAELSAWTLRDSLCHGYVL